MNIQTLYLAEDVFDALQYGKEVTIRKGSRDIKKGKLLFYSTEEKRQKVVEVLDVQVMELKDIPIDVLQNDGFLDIDDVFEQMKRFYPDIKFNSICTVIKFK